MRKYFLVVLAVTMAFMADAAVAAAAVPSNTGYPTISGNTQVGSTLTASSGQWTNSPTSYTYRWQDCASSGCRGIAGATKATYVLKSSDQNSNMSVIVTAHNTSGQNTAESAQSAPVQSSAPPPNPVPPSNTSKPTISGTAQVGNSLTADPGTWSGDTPITYTYAWSDGKTGKSITLDSSDQGQNIAVTVTANNDAGNSTATSDPVGPVQAAPPPPPPPPSGFQSVSYYLAWYYPNQGLSTIPWNSITQLDMFSLATCTNQVTSDCPTPSSLDASFNGVNQNNLSQFVNTVHANHRQAIITIGGSTNPNWYYACNDSNVSQFAQNLVNYMQSNGFDGVDLDIEQDATTGNPALTASMIQNCTADVYNDAKAIKTQAGNTPIVTSDVDPTTDLDIPKIQNPYVDQFNAMSYGATGSQLQSWIDNLHNQGVPYNKITAGIDVTGNHDCAGASSYASNNGLAGVMTWYVQASQENACLAQIQPYVAP